MDRTLIAGIAIASGLFFSAAYGQPGETWEVVTTTEVPEISHKESLTTHTCLPKGSEQDPRALLPPSNYKCEMTDIHSTGSKTTWKVHCQDDPLEMNGNGEINNNADSYHAVMYIQVSIPGGQQVGRPIVISYDGRRVGERCELAPPIAPLALSGQ